MRAFRILFILMVACMFCTVHLHAADESLRIGAGDTLQIAVLEAPDLQQKIRVSDSGEVSLIVGGSVNLKGTNPAQAARRIEDRLKLGNFVLNPHVSVTVEHYATQTVSIFGQVRSPGAYSIYTSRSVIEVLTLAGGLNEIADRHVTIVRHDTGERIPFFVSNSTEPAVSELPMVRPGDTVLVPKADVVYFLGNVARPGGYAKTTNDSKITVLQGLALAGGAPPSSAPAHSRLIRKNPDGTLTTTEINLSAIQKGKQPDFVLQSDDIIWVPFSHLRNMVVNASGLVATTAGAAIYHF